MSPLDCPSPAPRARALARRPGARAQGFLLGLGRAPRTLHRAHGVPGLAGSGAAVQVEDGHAIRRRLRRLLHAGLWPANARHPSGRRHLGPTLSAHDDGARAEARGAVGTRHACARRPRGQEARRARQHQHAQAAARGEAHCHRGRRHRRRMTFPRDFRMATRRERATLTRCDRCLYTSRRGGVRFALCRRPAIRCSARRWRAGLRTPDLRGRGGARHEEERAVTERRTPPAEEYVESGRLRSRLPLRRRAPAA